MKVSANEVVALATKAARGAGAPPAQAGAFGRVALHHLASGRSDDTLSEALEALPEGPILTLPLAFMRVLDAGAEGVRLSKFAEPADLVRSYAEAQPYAVAIDPDSLTVTAMPDQPATPLTLPRVDLSEAFANQLNALAARTYVPESDASRSAGAGAGLTDND